MEFVLPHKLFHTLPAAEDSNKSAKPMLAVLADVEELVNSYVYTIDIPGLKHEDVKVQVENDKVLVVSGEKNREEKKGRVRCFNMERQTGTFVRKFWLQDNANLDDTSAVCRDGVLMVTVGKLHPPSTKKPKIIEVKMG